MNYRHLRYFWMAARLGGIGPAARELHLTPQTLSGQIHELEQALGTALFRKAGRRLEVTDEGRMAWRFADAIFALGGELETTLKGQTAADHRIAFRVGVTDAVPKSVAYRLLQPAMAMRIPVRFVNRAGKLDALLSELAVHRLDLVLADAAIPAGVSIKAFNHLLGRSGIAFFATPALCKRAKGPFPRNLQKLPLLIPGPDTAVTGRLKIWLEREGLDPPIAGEFDDGALMKAFGQRGEGAFVAPAVLRADIEARYGVKCLGQTEEVVEEFYALSAERRIKHPCVAAITTAARGLLSAVSRPTRGRQKASWSPSPS